MSLKRINSGRGHRYELDGRSIPGVTTILRNGYPKPALVGAAARESGNYVVNYWDDLQEMKPAQRLEAVRTAHQKAWYGAAVRGTEVHDLAARWLSGDEVQVPEPLVGHVDSYIRFANEWQPKELLVEAPIGNRTHGYAGTLDLVATLADGQNWLLDYKTSKSEPYPEVALQLAGYRHAEFYAGPDGIELPLPRIDMCGVVWVRADGYELVPVNADLHAFYTLVYACLKVAQFMELPRDYWIRPPISPPVQEAV